MIKVFFCPSVDNGLIYINMKTGEFLWSDHSHNQIVNWRNLTSFDFLSSGKFINIFDI